MNSGPFCFLFQENNLYKPMAILRITYRNYAQTKEQRRKKKKKKR